MSKNSVRAVHVEEEDNVFRGTAQAQTLGVQLMGCNFPWMACQLGSKLTLAQMSWSNLRQQLESPWNQQASPSVAQANTFYMLSSHGTEEVHVEEEILIVQGLPMFLLGHPAIKWSQIGSDKNSWLFWKRRCSGSVIETCIATAIACSYAYSYICSVVEL